jgi:hypothetical protein
MLLKYMNKLAIVALLGIALSGALPAFAAGTIPLALTQQVDINGKPLANCQVSFFVAGTVSTPQNSYSDFSLSQNPNSILSCDQTGRIPMFWLADGLIHVRLTDQYGTPVVDTTMQVLGPSSGGGGGGSTVDPTTVMATGDMKARYGTGALAGFVRLNGLTIGNAVSGSTERANADTQALFVYLYTTDPNLAVSGGRTGNALNDFNANKQLTLPDFRGRALAFLDDMGNSAAGRLTAGFYGTAATVLGAAGGAQSATLLTANLPPYTPAGTNGTVTVTTTQSNINFGSASSTTGGGAFPFNYPSNSGTITSTGSGPAFTGTPQGGASTPFATVQPTILSTVYIKL